MRFTRPTAAEDISSDASHRRYRRLWLDDGRTVVEVRYPDDRADELARDLEVFEWLRRRGIHVPKALEVADDEPTALLDDLGTDDAAAILRTTPPSRRRSLAARLLRPLAALSRLDSGDLPPWNPPLDGPRLRWELTGFELWFVRYGMARVPDPDVSRWLDDLAERIAAHPRRICHRDYHLNNLFLLEDGVGVIDAQDVRIGPDTYDLASLLDERDAPVLLTPEDRSALAVRWAELTGAGPGWRLRLAETTAQRGLKVIGTFSRLLAGHRTRYAPWLEVSLERTAEMLAGLDAPPILVRWCRKEAH